MEALFRFVSGVAAGIAALFAPIGPLAATTVVFIGVDFLSGVAADRAAALREGRAWYFESCKAWRTVLKLALALTAISMAWLIDSCVLDFMRLNLAASYGVHLRRGAVVVSRKRRAALRRSAVPLAAPLRAPPHPEGGRR